jgi:glycosyltransferase involved in cell wall biosynthesis
MRIVSINVHYQDGLGYQDYYLGKSWKALGHEVHFISSDWHFDYPDYESVRHIIGDKYVGVGTFVNDYGVPVHRLKATTRKQTGLMWLKGFEEKLIALRPDIIISHGVFSYQSIRLLYLKNKLNCPIVFDDHTTINVLRESLSSKIIFTLFRVFFAKRMLKVAHKIVGISDSCMVVLDKTFGLKGNNVVMIPLGTDTNLFKQDQDLRKKYRKFLGVDDETIVVLYTGKIYEDKKVDLLIDALNDEAVTLNKSIVIHIVGVISTEYKAYFEAKLKTSEHKVIYRNAVSQQELPEIYNGADIAVWPAHTTNSTIDASACGCPIICSDYMKERYSNNNGFGIKEGDISELKTVLKQLIDDDHLRKEMGQEGIELVKKELSWESISNLFLN